VQVGEVTEECLGMAWVTFESLENIIAAATSLAAKAVNRNQIGYKRYNFRPLRYHIYCAILFLKVVYGDHKPFGSDLNNIATRTRIMRSRWSGYTRPY